MEISNEKFGMLLKEAASKAAGEEESPLPAHLSMRE